MEYREILVRHDHADRSEVCYSAHLLCKRNRHAPPGWCVGRNLPISPRKLHLRKALGKPVSHWFGIRRRCSMCRRACQRSFRLIVPHAVTCCRSFGRVSRKSISTEGTTLSSTCTHGSRYQYCRTQPAKLLRFDGTFGDTSICTQTRSALARQRPASCSKQVISSHCRMLLARAPPRSCAYGR
jgi:hypothetical protein